MSASVAFGREPALSFRNRSAFRRRLLVLAALLLAALIPRLVCLHFAGVPRETVKYLACAETIRSGDKEKLDAFPAHIWSYCRLLAFFEPQHMMAAGRMLNLLCGLLLIVVCRQMGEEISGSGKVAAAAALLAAGNPFLVENSTVVLRDTPGLLLFAAALLCLLRGSRTELLRYYVLAGIAGAAAVAIRLEEAELLLCGALIAGYQKMECGRIQWRGWFCFAAVLLVTFFVILLSLVPLSASGWGLILDFWMKIRFHLWGSA